jgi:predicted DNA-binding transcriptional regulator AlpA
MTKTARAYLIAQAEAIGVPAPDDLLTTAGVCRVLGGISVMALWRRRKTGGFPAPDVVINRINFWRRSTVQAWIAKQETAYKRTSGPKIVDDRAALPAE